MALPKEPRQKMINIMYLVLTALLALNVSAEILNAFKTVDRSLTSTNTTINESTSTIMASFKDKLAENETREKAQAWMPFADKAVAEAAALNTYIEQLKKEILAAAGFDPAKKKGDSSFKEDNQDVATRLMIEQGKGKQLYARLDAYKKAMINLGATSPDPRLKEEIAAYLKQIDLSTPPSRAGNKNWEQTYFHMVPTVAALTILSKFQNDIKTSENRTVALFHEQVGKVVVRYDAFAAIVGQSSNYIMPGQEIEISAGVGAFSRAAQPQISINGQSAPIGSEGQAKLKVAGGGIGKHSIPVVIRFMDQDGKMQEKRSMVEYTVGQANASIALDKMNVLYIGVDNPVTIAASGGGDDRVQASISSGQLVKVGPGKYVARVNTPSDDTKISVSVDGKIAGVSQFRVRTVPSASAYVGGYISGATVTAGAFLAQQGVGAGIKDFPFELSYRVVSCTVSCDNDEGDVDVEPVQGNTWSGRAAQMLRKNVKSGRMVTVDQIRVQGPDGRTTPAPSLVYYIR